MNKTPISLSIVIPTYNEERRLEPTLSAAIEYMKIRSIEGEIIISDDCSSDGTLGLATKLLKDIPSMVISHSVHHGKGWAVRRGILASHGKAVLFTDADMSTPFSMLDSMLPWLNRGYRCVIGVRKQRWSLRGAYSPLLRLLLGWTYLNAAKVVLGISYTDINCGFKLFEGKTARHLFTLQQQWDWGFDAEILFLIKKFKYKVIEVPVVWHHKEGSKVMMFYDIPHSLFSLIQIRLRMWAKRYSG